MQIYISTKVKGRHEDIMEQFDRDLFEALEPPVGKMEIVEFTGSKTGDKVHLRFLSPIKADWVSKITEDYQDKDQSYFIDVGTELPWPLKQWRHKHIVRQLTENSAEIIDQISFSSGSKPLDIMIYPILYGMFSLRKPIYKRFFK